MKEFFRSRFLIGLLSLTFVALNVSAQQDFNTREFFIEAESFFLFEEYKDALPLYQRILSKEPQNYNVMYKIGICYLNDPYQKSRSIKYLTKASDHINQRFRANSFKEKLSPPDVLYYLAQAHRINGTLDKALKYYAQFKDIVDPSEYNLEVVNAEIESCKSAKKLIKSPVYNKSQNVGDEINSRFADIRPVMSGDGKTIIYTRLLQFYDAIFISTLNPNGKWTPPYNLTPEFGLDGNSYTTGISYNADEIFVYRSDDYDGNIYSSKKIDGKWQVLKKLNENINTKYWESHASLSPDGQHLYFSSNRKGGYGGLDIYRSSRETNGEWGIPVNLGPVVNSPYNDDNPFLSPNGNELYFSSLGHDGMGGYDIFVARKTESESWTRPVNMGYPLNTTDDDMFFCPIENENFTGLHSTYEQQSTYGLMDLYWKEIYNDVLPRDFNLRGRVNTPIPSVLSEGNIIATLVDNKTGKIISKANLDETGMFALIAPQGNYQLLIDGEGIKAVSVPVDLKVDQEDGDIDLALITASASDSEEDNMVVPIATLPELKINGEQNIVTDTTPVSINLNVEKGSDLKVETFLGNELVSKDDFHVSKNNFTYTLDPQPGENKVVFTITDDQGKTNQEEVYVYYTPKAIAEAIEQDVEEEIDPEPTALSEVALIAPSGLQTYLLTLGDIDFSSSGELYNTLIANADENDYSVTDVNDLFSVMLTQRDKDEFLSDLNSTKEFDNRRLSDTLLEKLNMPMGIVHNTKDSYSKDKEEINTGLISMVPYKGSNSNKLSYILSFIDKKLPTHNNVSNNLLRHLEDITDSEKLEEAVNLSSTTQPLESFYQKLLVSSRDSLRKILQEINFEKFSIDNSVDLVNYLFTIAPEQNIKPSDLISLIQAARQTDDINLLKFKNALANHATGDLKMTIDNINLSAKNISSYEDLLNELLLQSTNSNYSPQEVYELLLNLLGINSVSELAKAFLGKSTTELDSLINTTDLNLFSNPVELLQYLITQSPYFDYTESEINNLLLRMLLEKGIDNYVQDEGALQSEKLIKKKRLITTAVLGGALILVLLLIFWRRNKKKQTE